MALTTSIVWYVLVASVYFLHILPGSSELDCATIERYVCQVMYYDEYRDALANYQKARIDVNKFYVSRITEYPSRNTNPTAPPVQWNLSDAVHSEEWS